MSTSAKALSASSQVPDMSGYIAGTDQTSSRAYSYFMVGSMGLITAAGAKSTVTDFLANMSASADVLALAKVEVDISTIPEGKNVIIKVSTGNELLVVWVRRPELTSRSAPIAT
jgi:ubiquinol-cytochrome c reductase iron-sulfur subunit